MLERSFSVKYVNQKNCFCYLSSSVVNNLNHKECIKVQYQDLELFCSIGPPVESVKEDEIGISSMFSKALGLEESVTVTVSELPKLPVISSLSVSSLNQSDYEVTELLSHEIQNQLLSQIVVVNKGQKFVVWIGNSISLTLLVDNIEPVSPGCLGALTEVVIKPPDTAQRVISGNKYAQALFDFNLFKQLLVSDPEVKEETLALENRFVDNSELVLRAVPFPKFLQWQNIPRDEMSENSFTIFNAYVFRFSLSKDWPLQPENINVCYLRVLKARDESRGWMTNNVYVKLCIIDDLLQDIFDPKECSQEDIFLHDNLMEYLRLEMGERVILKPLDNLNAPPVKEVCICSKKYLSLSVIEEFRKEIANACQNDRVVINADVPICIDSRIVCCVRLSPGSWCVVDPEFLRECTFSWKEEVVVFRQTKQEDEGTTLLSDIANFNYIMDSSVIYFLSKMKYQYHRHNLIITGKVGMGKSTLLKLIEEKLHKLPYFPYIEKINCKTIKGKSLETLKDLFSICFMKLINQQPSVLLLDDVHVICEHIEEVSGMAQRAVYFNRISEMLHNMFYSYTSTNFITIVATSESLSKLNKNIYESRGSHLFQKIHDISDLSKRDKVWLIELLFSKYNTDSDIDLDSLASKTDGFVIQDIVDFVDKAAFMAVQKVQDDSEDANFVITQEDCTEALKNTVALSLDSINLHSPGDRDFSDIGGLNDIKKLLIENLLWPVQYPGVFDKAPLRLQSGLLLYGVPGTGKTLLAGAAAKHCGLRLISVKGPELLSKYIGASEQAVREIFDKAQRARPCILFFDEFDSLAPRRGHDNTGVTDRIVNQLLTQLDGVEGLTGVCVLAATSRPDLLDPALLRPGRLDRQVKCTLPTEVERLEILKVLSKMMKLNVDVNLQKIAAHSDGFSGADLQSLLYTAQLSSVEYLFDSKETTFTLSEVCQKHLEEALKKTRPSLTNEEKLRYDKIYRKFEGGILTGFDVGAKATLA